MSGINKSGKDYTGYDYKELIVDSGLASVYLDGYENFGWLSEQRQPGKKGSGKTVLRLKRDRRIVNKTELTRLQKNFEDCIRQIGALEQSKTNAALAAALITGVAGTAFMAGSVFAITAEPPGMLLSILLAVPGILGWILPWFIYRGMNRKKTEQLRWLIEEKQDELNAICEKGYKLLL